MSKHDIVNAGQRHPAKSHQELLDSREIGHSIGDDAAVRFRARPLLTPARGSDRSRIEVGSLSALYIFHTHA
jgi:hypothetical protein